MKKIKEFLSNKNIIIIMCVIVILGLSIALVLSLNSDSNNTNKNKAETNAENNNNLLEEIELENKNDVNDIDNKINNSSTSKKEKTTQKNTINDSSEKEKTTQKATTNVSSEKEKTTQKATTNVSSEKEKITQKTTTPKKEETQTNNDSLNTNKTYICPSGYTLSNDKKKCYKVTELVKKYKCENNYILNSDNTCTGLVIIETTVSYYCGGYVTAGGYRYDDTDKKCYYENGTGLHKYTKEQCEEKNLVYSDGLNRCFISKKDANVSYSCPNGWTRKGNETCEKYETISATEYYGCDDGYTLNSSKDSCIKTIASTIKE